MKWFLLLLLLCLGCRHVETTPPEKFKGKVVSVTPIVDGAGFSHVIQAETPSGLVFTYLYKYKNVHHYTIGKQVVIQVHRTRDGVTVEDIYNVWFDEP